MSKPVLGAALSIKSIPAHRDWLLERQRDLEIQDFFRADLLDSDWRSTAGEIKQMLSGHTGRLGIHGPFWGFKIDSHDPMIRQAVTKRLLQGLDAAEFLGATQMVVHSPFTTWDHNNLDLYPDNRGNIVERVKATLAEVIARARRSRRSRRRGRARSCRRMCRPSPAASGRTSCASMPSTSTPCASTTRRPTSPSRAGCRATVPTS